MHKIPWDLGILAIAAAALGIVKCVKDLKIPQLVYVNEQGQHSLLTERTISTSPVRGILYNLEENTHYFNFSLLAVIFFTIIMYP